jgi:hypothetical protein
LVGRRKAMNERLLRALESGKDVSAAIEEAAAPMNAAIQQFLQQRPFQPFRLSLTGGSVHEIRNPEWVTLGLATLTLNVPDPTAPGGFRWQSVLALEHVVCLEPMIADEPAVIPFPRSTSK